jgi:DNA replication ATP-dependent helicase Dna2
MSISEIQSAILSETQDTPEYFDFKVRHSLPDGKLWRVSVDTGLVYIDGNRGHVVLDESFEGATAWWAGPQKGGGEVLTVIPEEEQIVIRYATTHPPSEGGRLRLYPPRFLDALRACWFDAVWSDRAWSSHGAFRSPIEIEHNPLSGHAFRWLRQAQRQALKLVGISPSFLWGPPGTGKTTALGVLAAEYLHANPRARVLLLSTTNQAVDQALISVDKALESAGRQALRESIKRIGSRFVASHYANREHLIPVIDKALVRQLAESEAARPDSSDVAAYSDWVEQVEALRAKVQQQNLAIMGALRLAAMTTTRGVFTLKDLRLLSPYDLIIFDEASQIGLAHALAMMPMGRCHLFAGDPCQLSPIVRSQSRNAQQWLGRSPFALKPVSGDSLCFLDEQSRMASPICSIISHVFYRGALKVSKKAIEDEIWAADRQCSFGSLNPEQHVHIESVSSDGLWSQNYGGPIRFESAQAIAKLVADAKIQGEDVARDVVVLTPFRAQRALVKQQLAKAGIRGVKVSTVHRAQGGEFRVVIFDPVEGENKFLHTEEARHLVNVAISRAQAKIVIFLSKGDLSNPLFQQIHSVIELAGSEEAVAPIAEFLDRPDFPECVINKHVRIANHIGKVIEVNKGELTITNLQSGARQSFDLAVLRSKKPK